MATSLVSEDHGRGTRGGSGGFGRCRVATGAKPRVSRAYLENPETVEELLAIYDPFEA